MQSHINHEDEMFLHEIAYTHDPDIFGWLVLDTFYDNKNPSHFRKGAVIAMMLHTRDIVIGRGKYGIFYTLVVTFDKMIDAKEPYVSRQKTETMRLILQKVVASCVYLTGYGSWKDMKYLLNSLRDIYGEDAAAKKSIFKYIVAIISNQLNLDATSAVRPTLAAKWAPREKSKMFGWQAKYIALYAHPEWCGGTLNVANAPASALKKCLTHYRKTIASINRTLKTPQINQCTHDWASINFEKNASRTTMEKQELAFKYVSKDGGLRTRDSHGIDPKYSDRICCRENYISNQRRNQRHLGGSIPSPMTRSALCHPRYEWVWNDPLICHAF